MLTNGFFAQSGQSGSSASYNTNLSGDVIIYKPIDNIFIEDGKVYYSDTKRNGILFIDDKGRLFAKEVETIDSID